MQIERLFYWFTDPEWWLGATQGTVGALIGFIGLFIVFRLTRSHDIERDREAREEERERDREAREQERERLTDERNLAGIVEIYQKVLMVRVRGSAETTREHVDDLANSLMLFSLRESVDYPNASKWAYDQSWCFDEWSRKEVEYGDLFIYAQTGALAGTLTGWVTEGRGDYLFEGMDVDKEWEEEYVKLKEEEDKLKEEEDKRGAEASSATD